MCVAVMTVTLPGRRQCAVTKSGRGSAENETSQTDSGHYGHLKGIKQGGLGWLTLLCLCPVVGRG